MPVIESIEINSSRKSEPDTATIKVPRLGNLDLNTIKVYDRVVIRLGHEEGVYAPRDIFYGVVQRIAPNYPLEIICQDWLWLIRRAWYSDPAMKLPTKDNSESINAIMIELINDLKNNDEKFADLNLITSEDFNSVKYYGEFPIGNRNYGAIFDDLLQHGWDMFMIPGEKTLWFGPRDNLPIVNPQQWTPIFASGLNILNPDIKYETASGIKKVEIRAKTDKRKSKDADGTYEPSDNDKNGETLKFEIPGVDKNANFTPNKYAELMYMINSKQGLSGQFKTFGLSFFHHWHKCKLEVGLPGKYIDNHFFPSAIDYRYSSSDGFKMDVKFENSREGGASIAA